MRLVHLHIRENGSGVYTLYKSIEIVPGTGDYLVYNDRAFKRSHDHSNMFYEVKQ